MDCKSEPTSYMVFVLRIEQLQEKMYKQILMFSRLNLHGPCHESLVFPKI